MSETKNRCAASVSDGGRFPTFHQCHNTAWKVGEYWGKQVPLCRTHHPDAKAERAARRKPTKFELALKRVHARVDREARLLSALRAALAMLEEHEWQKPRHAETCGECCGDERRGHVEGCAWAETTKTVREALQ